MINPAAVAAAAAAARHPVPGGPPTSQAPPPPFKLNIVESIERIKEEFNFLQAQYHNLKLECEKLVQEKTEMQRHYVMYYEMSYGLNVEMHKQTEICKRLDAIIRQVLPFLSAEHQTQVAMAVDRAKQITMAELNAVMQQAASGGIPGMPGIPGLPPGMAPPGTPGLPPGLAGLPGMPPTSMASGLLSLAGHPGLPPISSAPPGALGSMAGLPPGAPNPLAHLASLQRPGAPSSAPGGPPGLPHLPESRDEKPPLAAMEERLKNSSSASPLSSLRGGDRGRSPGPPGASLSSRGSPSSGGGERRR